MKRQAGGGADRVMMALSATLGLSVTVWLLVMMTSIATPEAIPAHLARPSLGGFTGNQRIAVALGDPRSMANSGALDQDVSTHGQSQRAARVRSDAHPMLWRAADGLPQSSSPACVMWGTWSEACYYENVCFDPRSRTLLMYNKEVASRPSVSDEPKRRKRRGPGIFDRDSYAAKLGNVYESHNDLLTAQVLPLEVMPPEDFPKWLPMNSNLRARFMGHQEAKEVWTATRAEATAFEQSPDVSRLDDVAWITSNKEHLSNIWYYSSRITPWFELRLMNRTSALPFVLPEPTTIYLQTPRSLVSSDWHRSILSLALDLPVPDLFAYAERQSAAEVQVAAGRRLPHVVYKVHGSKGHAHADGQETDEQADFQERRRCFRSVIVTGASGFLFGSMHAASEFRANALELVGRGSQPKYLGPGVMSLHARHNPPRKVLLIDRQRGRPRAITNVDAVKRLLDQYEVPYTHSVDFRGTFEEQVKLYNDHGIVLGAHGAGFINCMFMRQGSAVIEIFPYHLKHTLYTRQAYVSGLMHFGVYATDPSAIFKPGNWLREYMTARCEQLPSLMTQWRDNACRGPLVGAQVAVPLRPLEEALVQALDMIGYRTDYRGFYNSEPMFTEGEKAKFATMLQTAADEGAAKRAAKKTTKSTATKGGVAPATANKPAAPARDALRAPAVPVGEEDTAQADANDRDTKVNRLTTDDREHEELPDEPLQAAEPQEEDPAPEPLQ